MATYCIGDLHGRFDLFQLLLDKINFNPAQDKLYLLGDVIDRNYGGIKILLYLMAHPNSCFLIEGNHESQFIYMYKAYDLIMLNPQIKESMALAVDVYSANLFEPISELFSNCLSKKNVQVFYKNREIKNWLNNGDTLVRKKLLDAMIHLVDSFDYDEHIYQNVMWVLSNLRSQYKTKPFVQELLKHSSDTYVQIKEYLKKLNNCYKIECNNQIFQLSHWKGQINRNVSYKIQHPHATTKNIIYIFGHDPLPMLHSKIQSNSNRFNFDYRQIFSWTDTNKNRYYWLDLGSNPIAAIKLEDMSEYYVGIPSTRKNAHPWTVPQNVYPPMGKSYLYVENAGLCGVSSLKTAFVTLDNGCYEFLIGITKKNRIHYTHVGWMEAQCSFTIEEPFTNQPIEEIIESVQEAFINILASNEYQYIFNSLHGIKN